MATKKLVALKEFCSHHNVSTDFILKLFDHDLIEFVLIRRTRYIAEKDLHSLEKIVRLYTDLQVNPEGIPAILHLLSRLEQKEKEIIQLRNQLAFYVD